MSRASSDFGKYREMAPAIVPDEKIIEVIESSGGDVELISKAIENMWHDLPDSKAVNPGVDWDITPTEKKKMKKKGELASSSNDTKGKSKENHQFKELRVDKNSSSARSSKAAVTKSSLPQGPAGHQKSALAPTQSSSSHEKTNQAPMTTPSSSASGNSLWTSTSMTFAEKLKQAEAAKAAAAEAPVDEHEQNVHHDLLYLSVS